MLRVWAPGGREFHSPSFQVSVARHLLPRSSCSNLPCVLPAHRLVTKGQLKMKVPCYRLFGHCWQTRLPLLGSAHRIGAVYLRRTNRLSLSGVFGARKTRAAAAMISGLLVMDPSLEAMVVPRRMQRHMPLPSTLSLYSSLPPWKTNLVDWWVSRSLKRALPVKRDWMSLQASAMRCCAENR